MSIRNYSGLKSGVASRLPGDFATHEQITEAAKRLQQQATLTTGPEDAIAPADSPAGQDRAGMAAWRGNVLTIVMPGAPIGKPRMTQRDKWAQRPAVLRYREWADRLREIAGAVPDAEKVVSLSWTAYFEPPRSWSKSRRVAAIGKTHRAKPDRDNVDKAVLDVLYPDGDQGIADGVLRKRWDWEPRLEIRIEASE